MPTSFHDHGIGGSRQTASAAWISQLLLRRHRANALNDYGSDFTCRYQGFRPMKNASEKRIRKMKALRTVVTYDREKTCIEDVIAIANEIARGIPPSTALNANKNETYPQGADKRRRAH